MTKAPDQTMKANGPIAMQVDSFAPAHSAFGFPIYVAPLPADSIQRVCHDTLPWLISLTHDLPSSFALAGYPVYLADSQSAGFSLGIREAIPS